MLWKKVRCRFGPKHPVEGVYLTPKPKICKKNLYVLKKRQKKNTLLVLVFGEHTTKLHLKKSQLNIHWISSKFWYVENVKPNSIQKSGNLIMT